MQFAYATLCRASMSPNASSDPERPGNLHASTGSSESSRIGPHSA
jgi:hypothetical protein